MTDRKDSVNEADTTDDTKDIEALRAERDKLDEECQQSMLTIARERERAEKAEAERDEAVEGKQRAREYLADAQHRAGELLGRVKAAEAEAAALRERVEKAEGLLADLASWVWDEVGAELPLDDEGRKAVAEILATSPDSPDSPEPFTVETRDRQTFEVPPGYVAVRDARGRATGQVVADSAEPRATGEAVGVSGAGKLTEAEKISAALGSVVGGRVIISALEDGDYPDSPAWLWRNHETNVTGFGRWSKGVGQAPYIRADLVVAALTAALSAPAEKGRQPTRRWISDPDAVLKRLADGDRIVFSEDGEMAWFCEGDQAFVNEATLITLRREGYLVRKGNDGENYRGKSEYDTISEYGRSALATPTPSQKGGA